MTTTDQAAIDAAAEATEQHHIELGRTNADGNSPCSCGQWWDSVHDRGWDEHMAEIAYAAMEPILRQAIIDELTRTTGAAVRKQLREILAMHNANFCAEHQIDERTQQIIDLIVPAARLQERPRVPRLTERQDAVEQFKTALLDGLDDLDRDEHRRISPGAVADLVHRVALEVGRP